MSDLGNGNSGISPASLMQPTDSDPRPSVSMDFQPVHATGYPDGWRVMDDYGFRFVVRDGQWHPQEWPEEVIRRLEAEAVA